MTTEWKIESNYRTLSIKILLSNKITVLLDMSGVGKSFISRKLLEMDEVRHNVTLVDCYTIKELPYKIQSHNNNGSNGLIIFDNADIYMDKLVSELKNVVSGFALVICKNDFELCKTYDVAYADCVYEHDSIRLGDFNE